MSSLLSSVKAFFSTPLFNSARAVLYVAVPAAPVELVRDLAFSTQAAYAAPLILLSQKRSDQVASEEAHHTLQNTELIKDLIRQNTELTEAVRDLAAEIREHLC